jgi:hypothetical protein
MRWILYIIFCTFYIQATLYQLSIEHSDFKLSYDNFISAFASLALSYTVFAMQSTGKAGKGEWAAKVGRQRAFKFQDGQFPLMPHGNDSYGQAFGISSRMSATIASSTATKHQKRSEYQSLHTYIIHLHQA